MTVFLILNLMGRSVLDILLPIRFYLETATGAVLHRDGIK